MTTATHASHDSGHISSPLMYVSVASSVVLRTVFEGDRLVDARPPEVLVPVGEVDEPVRIRKGDGPQDRPVEHAEDRRVGTDTQAQRDDGPHLGKESILQQHQHDHHYRTQNARSQA